MAEEIKDKEINMKKLDEKIKAEEKVAGGIKNLIKKFAFPVILLAILIYQVGIYVYNHGAVEDAWDPNEWEDMTPVYPTEMVMRQTLEDTIYAKGNLETEDEGDIKSKASGKIQALFVKEGDYVTEGQAIARIDSQEFMLRYERAKLALERAKLEQEKINKQGQGNTVYADEAGQLVTLSVREGDKITYNQIVGKVNLYNKMEMRVAFRQEQLEYMKVGDSVDVFLLDFLYNMKGEVTKISSVPRPNNVGAVVYDVDVMIENPGGITEGSRAKVVYHRDNNIYDGMEPAKIKVVGEKDLKADVAGTVSKVHVEEGDIINIGSKILSLDTSEKSLEAKEREFNIREQELSLGEMANEMKHFTIVAEEAGLISDLYIKVNQQVSAEMKVASLATESLVVKAKVDELDIAKVYLGQTARIESDAYRDEIFLGEVVKIADKATPKGSGAEFDVTIKLVDARDLRAGMSVYIDIVVDELVDALVIPVDYVEYEGDETYVWVRQNIEYGGQTTDQNIDNNIDGGDYRPGTGGGAVMPMPMPRTAEMPVMEEGMDADMILEGEFMDGEIGDMDLDFGEAGPVEFEEPEAVRTLVILGKEIGGMVEALDGLSEGDMIENRSGGGMNDWGGGGMDYWGGGGMIMGGGMIRY